ncbi:MAG: hypothetical protein QME90_19610, partial [Thermodesulfobacteriota bacterium]|nr:hypothetical protein [Thermodesulfobacteriota bacterium]
IDARPGLPISQTLKPPGVSLGLPNFDHNLIVSHGIQKSKKNLYGPVECGTLLTTLNYSIGRDSGQAADAFKLLKMFVKGKGAFQFASPFPLHFCKRQ